MTKIQISAKVVSSNGNYWVRTDVNVDGWLVSKFLKPATKEQFDALVIGSTVEVPSTILQ